MKIAIIASIWIKLPPDEFGFGAQEYLTYYLAEKLKTKGHEVTLFASGDSQVSTELVSITRKQLKDNPFPDKKIKDVFELINLNAAYQLHNQFDLIHNQLLPYGLLFSSLFKTPTVHTLHHQIYPDRADIFLYKKYKNENFISISQAQQDVSPSLNFIANVHNGVDTQFYSYHHEQNKNRYLVYLGRLRQYKGIHTAIAVAEKLGLGLKIAGPLPTPNHADFNEVSTYWDNQIKPHLKNKIEYVGSVKGREKVELLQNATSLIFPVEREEPFGMTIIEALSCGTPTIAFSRGAIPELIIDGKTGFIIKPDVKKKSDTVVQETGLEGLCAAVKRIYSMPEEKYANMRKLCRQHAEKNFAIEQMVNQYEKVYKLVLSNSQTRS